MCLTSFVSTVHGLCKLGVFRESILSHSCQLCCHCGDSLYAGDRVAFKCPSSSHLHHRCRVSSCCWWLCECVVAIKWDCVCVCVCAYVHVSVCMHYVCLSVCLSVYMFFCVFIWLSILRTLQLGGALRPNRGVCHMSNATTPVYYDMATELVRVTFKHELSTVILGQPTVHGNMVTYCAW